MTPLTSVDQYCPLDIWLDSEEENGVDVSALRILTEYGFTAGYGWEMSSSTASSLGCGYNYNFGAGYGYGYERGRGYSYGYKPDANGARWDAFG
jgi:hypothetical protein